MSSATWTKRAVEIAVATYGKRGADGKLLITRRAVDALVWGVFAIHEPVGTFREGVAVSHIPSGWGLAVAKSEEAAQQFCVEVAPLMDWAALTTETCRAVPRRVKANIRAAQRRAQEAQP